MTEDEPKEQSIPIAWILNHPKLPKDADKRRVIEDMIEDWLEEQNKREQ